MKHRYRILTALLLTAAVFFTSLPAGAVRFDDLDRRSADAGASLVLSAYFSENPGAGEALYQALKPLIDRQAAGMDVRVADDDEMDMPETTYDTPEIGVVCVPGALNLRETTSTLSPVVAQVFRNYEVLVLDEAVVNGFRWYRVGIYQGTHLTEGYTYADYVKYGEEAAVYYADLHAQEKSVAEMPEAIHVSANDEVPEEAEKELNEQLSLINYSLANDYDPNDTETSYMNRYAVLSYIVELYQGLSKLAEKYNLQETLAQSNRDLYNVVLIRETLIDESGGDETELQAQIAEARAQRREIQVMTLGESIAEYAATFVGSLPYVWGGASLVHGADCSGFAAQIYAHFGLIDQGMANVHGYDSRTLRSVGYGVDLASILPGDLVCYNGHVAIYYGNGLCVNEPAPGRRCSFNSLYMLPIICIRRLQ
ncbi:MAG: C40 family peptidase [Lachnospiraceae bacterium]|nr:C40 family peptidase [Lachnospiraceae bacterium]